MPRYIDADALKAHIIKFACDPCKKYGADRDGIRCPFCNTGNLLGEIDDAPTSDVPENNVGNIEPLTDAEQRIFLAAMGREEMICKKVDVEMRIQPYEVSLVSVCSEIERKVKKALWVN